MWFSFTVTNGGFRGSIYTSEGHKIYHLFFQLLCVLIPSGLKAAVCHFYAASYTKIEAELQKNMHISKQVVQTLPHLLIPLTKML